MFYKVLILVNQHAPTEEVIISFNQTVYEIIYVIVISSLTLMTEGGWVVKYSYSYWKPLSSKTSFMWT